MDMADLFRETLRETCYNEVPEEKDLEVLEDRLDMLNRNEQFLYNFALSLLERYHERLMRELAKSFVSLNTADINRNLPQSMDWSHYRATEKGEEN